MHGPERLFPNSFATTVLEFIILPTDSFGVFRDMGPFPLLKKRNLCSVKANTNPQFVTPEPKIPDIGHRQLKTGFWRFSLFFFQYSRKTIGTSLWMQ